MGASRHQVTLVLACLVLVFATPAWGFSIYRDRIPNGYNVQHPCDAGLTWAGVGHFLSGGTGPWNPFGEDFADIGNHQWTVRLCQLDSDGDGRTNGEELGDPNCIWTENSTPEITTGITHPGICTPADSDECRGRPDLFDCEKLPTPVNRDCKNKPGVVTRNITFPRTKVPDRETTYVCYTFDAAEANNTYMIGLDPIIDNRKILHHMIIYGCPESTPITDEPVDCIMGAGCDEVIGVWAPGLYGVCLPDDVGFYFGVGGYAKIQLEFHWNNPELYDDQFDASGISMYFEEARPEMSAAGVFVTGQTVLQIPQGQSKYEQHGGCEGECTQFLWKAPLTLFAGINHMHYIGVAQYTSLWRNGTMIRDLASDNPASFDLPIYHFYDPPFQMFPGDELKTRCVYDSTSRDRTTYYGPGSYDEMCFFFAFYYPKANAIAPYCGQAHTLSTCERLWKLPLGDCDQDAFIKGVLDLSLPIASELQRYCTTTGQCEPECTPVVERLRQHPCMSDDKILYIATRLDRQREGGRFLARYSSCANSCPAPVYPSPYPTGIDGAGLGPVWSGRVTLLMLLVGISALRFAST